MAMLAKKYIICFKWTDYQGIPLESPSEIPCLLPTPSLRMTISMVITMLTKHLGSKKAKPITGADSNNIKGRGTWS